MVNSQQPLDEQLRLARERAALELAQLRSMDECALTPRMLVRKAILLQFEDAPDGTPQEIEAALESALKLDDKYIEAYIELGRYYYAVVDDSQKAKVYFLKALELLRGLNRETIHGLLDCEGELRSERDRGELQREYEALLVGPAT